MMWPWRALLGMVLANGSLAAVLRRAGFSSSCRTRRRSVQQLLSRHDPAVWARRLSDVLRARALELLGRHRVVLVADTCHVPYWGKTPAGLAQEVRSGPPKNGTTRAFAYLTVCALWRGERLVLGLAPWRAGQSVAEPLVALLDSLEEVRTQILLLDRGMAQADVLRALLARGLPFAVAAPRRGAKHGVAALLDELEAQWGQQGRRPPPQTIPYRMQPAVGEPVAVVLRVNWEPVRAQRGRRRQRTLRRSRVREGQRWRAVAWFTDGGDWRGRGRTVQTLYRRRQSIESSYRLSHACRGRTTARDAAWRLVLFALSQLLQNEWVWWRRGLRRGSGVGISGERHWRFITLRWQLMQHHFQQLSAEGGRHPPAIAASGG